LAQKRYQRHPARARQVQELERSSGTLSRLREFFEISSSKCSCCGEISPLPADYGVTDEASWNRKMDEHLAWARANKEAVLAALPHLPEWRESGAALREVLKSS
jgi:hypothetical protein